MGKHLLVAYNDVVTRKLLTRRDSALIEPLSGGTLPPLRPLVAAAACHRMNTSHTNPNGV